MEQKEEAIRAEARALLEQELGIVNTKTICQAVQDNAGVEVSMKQVRRVLKRDLHLSFVKAKKLYPNSNQLIVQVQRQQYAMALVRIMEEGKRIINLDETWLNETSFTRRVWAPKEGHGNVRLHAVMPRVSMIAALDTDGRVWYSL